MNNTEYMLTSITEGRDNKIVPFSIGIEVREGSNIYDLLMEATDFNKMLEKRLNIKREGAENNEYTKELDEQFKKDVEGAKVKIRIKIELEKYE